MNWLNLPVSLARSPEYIGCDVTQRSTWFSLLAYCAEQENGGVIRDCANWKDRRWQQTAAVTLEEVSADCDLFWWDGNDLHVAFYPSSREAQVQAGRTSGHKGGRPKKNPSENPPQNPSENPNAGKGKAPPKPEEKGREEKVSEEREEKQQNSAAASILATQAETLCLAHPSRACTGPSLRAATAALGKHPFELILEGTKAYAHAVAGWTPAERIQFVKNPEAFFRDAIWNQPADNWKSRTAARRENAQQSQRVMDLEAARASLGRRGQSAQTLP